MSLIGSKPHVVTVITPASTQGAGGETELDYAVDPDGDATSRQVRGLFQIRQQRVSSNPEGQGDQHDAKLYCEDRTIEVDDLVVVDDQGGVSGKFIVAHVDKKADLDGNYDHTDVLLVRETKYA